MEKQYEKKITWTIKNFSSLKSEIIYSDTFVVDGCKWPNLRAYPKGHSRADNFLSLYLGVANSESLPSGWKRRAKYSLTVVNQFSDKLSKRRESHNSLFDKTTPSMGLSTMLPLTKLLDKNGGFLVKDEVKIAAEVCVIEAIGKSDVLEETSLVKETIDVDGFQVFPSQVESVKSLFEKHPDIVSKFHPHNPQLRAIYLNVLLSLNEILCKSPEDLSNVDLANAYSTLTYVTKAGFTLDWLEKKLKEVGETRIQEIEKELKDLTQKCSDMNGLLEFLK